MNPFLIRGMDPDSTTREGDYPAVTCGDPHLNDGHTRAGDPQVGFLTSCGHPAAYIKTVVNISLWQISGPRSVPRDQWPQISGPSLSSHNQQQIKKPCRSTMTSQCCHACTQRKTHTCMPDAWRERTEAWLAHYIFLASMTSSSNSAKQSMDMNGSFHYSVAPPVHPVMREV